jgi:hypothetical protein
MNPEMCVASIYSAGFILSFVFLGRLEEDRSMETHENEVSKMCWDGKVITSSKPHVSLSSQHFPLIRIVCLKICLLHEFKLDVCYDQE